MISHTVELASHTVELPSHTVELPSQAVSQSVSHLSGLVVRFSVRRVQRSQPASHSVSHSVSQSRYSAYQSDKRSALEGCCLEAQPLYPLSAGVYV